MTDSSKQLKRFAPVVPVRLAKELKARNLLGDYHLLLAHDVVKHPAEYHDVYCDPAYTIIMDNSVIELGFSVDPAVIKDACDIVNASVFILPDVLLDGPQTVSAAALAYNKWPSIDWDKISPMVVPQGKIFSEWERCTVDLQRLGIPNCWVGIPRNFRTKLRMSRTIAADFVNEIFHGRASIHMLGFSDSLSDDMWSTCRGQNVRGIDSSVPIRQQTPIAMDQADPGPRGDWWDTCNPENFSSDRWRIIEHNLTEVNSWINFS